MHENVVLSEVRIGDSIKFNVVGEEDEDKRLDLTGWHRLQTIDSDTAKALIRRDYKDSILNDEGGNLEKLDQGQGDWQKGYGVAVLDDMGAPSRQSRFAVVLRYSEDKYFVLRPEFK